MDFLDENNLAGQSLLQLVARGSSIITELLRLSAQIPAEFYGTFHPPNAQSNALHLHHDVKKYDNVLFDFRYLKASESYDERIDRDLSWVDLDEEIRETHFTLLERYYKLFESMTKYADDLNMWLADLEKGAFLHLTLEHAFDDKDGTQLLCESLYLWGAMLLLLDLRIPGSIRERLIIAYYRYKGPHLVTTIDAVVSLCKDTGFISRYYPFLSAKALDFGVGTSADDDEAGAYQQQFQSSITNEFDNNNTMTITTSNLPQHIQPAHPPNYPHDYLARVELPQEFIDTVINKLRTEDIYFHISSFPAAEHQTIALSDQATLLFVCLHFKPDLLIKTSRQNFTVCRDIMSRFFVDNFIVALPAGLCIDLTQQWAMYPNMKAAIAETLTKETIAERLGVHQDALGKLTQEIDAFLVQGVLTDDYVMDNHKKILNTLRASNNTLRWALLHSHATNNPKLVKEFHKALSHTAILQLIILTASLECALRRTIERLIDTKLSRWVYLRTEASELTTEISEIYGGTKALTRITKKNEKLQKWFLNITTEIQNLEFEASNIIAGRTIQQLLSALTTVQENHQVEQSMQVVQSINDIKRLLTEMLRLSNITPKILADLDTVADFTYASRIINLYTPIIHQKIAHTPSLCLMLRNVFQKLSCILNKPLVRILQAQSADDISVAQYYSNELVVYVNRVLDVVPLTVFRLLDNISITMDKLGGKSLPLKIERRNIGELAQLNERYTLARLTNNISVFTRGVLSMSSTLLGIVQLDPQDILQNGIRKHLVYQVTAALHQHLQFITHKERLSTLQNFESKLINVGAKLTGLRVSFEYIQDFLNLFGLKIWQEEFCRLINFYIEQERNRFIKKKVVSWQSTYQSEMIPIPLYHSNNALNPSSSLTQIKDNYGLYHNLAISYNFMGRVVNELIKYSVPTHYIYCPTKLCWVGNGHSGQAPAGLPAINLRTFALINQGLGVFGLAGLDNLLSFILVKDISSTFEQYTSYTSNAAQSNLQQQQRNNINNQFPSLYNIDSSLGHSMYNLLAQVQLALLPTTQFPTNGMQLYNLALQRSEKVWLYSGFLQRIIKIGQLQLLRKHIQQELQYNAKSESPMLFNSLCTFNDALLNELTQHYNDQEQYSYPQNPILPEVSKYLTLAGKATPIDTIYCTTQQSTLHYIALSLFLLTIAVSQHLVWSRQHNTLIPADKKAARELHIDGVPFVVGLVTIFKQLHSSHTHFYLQLLGQYVRTVLSLQTKVTTHHTNNTNATTESDMTSQISTFKKIQEKQQKNATTTSSSITSADVLVSLVPIEAQRVLNILIQWSEIAHMKKEVLRTILPSYILDSFVRV